MEWINWDYVLNACICISAFVFGYGLACMSTYKKYLERVDKKLLGDSYYAYAIISFTYGRIDYYCGNIHVATDSFSKTSDDEFGVGMYNGYVHDSVLTIIDTNGEDVRSIYVDISNTEIVSIVMQNTFPVMVIS